MEKDGESMTKKRQWQLNEIKLEVNGNQSNLNTVFYSEYIKEELARACRQYILAPQDKLVLTINLTLD